MLVLASLGVAGGLFVAASSAAAETGQVSAQFQGYSATGGQDPYASDNPNDVHIGGYGGQPVVIGYVRLNLQSLPANSTVDGLRMTLVPNSSATDNANSATAAFEACLLTAPLNSNGFQANPPSYDCNTHVAAEPQANGNWTLELAPLVPKWKVSNTGMALVAYQQPNGTPIAVTPSAWSVAFAHDKTTATVDYTRGPVSSTDLTTSQPAFSGSSSTSVAPPAFGSVGPVPNLAAGQNLPAAAPSAAPTGPSQAAAPALAPVVINRPRLDKQWLWVAGALGGAAVLMLLVGAGQQALRGGHFNPSAALAASRSQLATPISVLSLAAVFALGSTTQTVGVLQQGGALGAQGGSAAGGSAAAGGGASAPGSGSAGSGAGGVATGGTVSGGSQATGGRATGGAAGSPGAPNGPGVTATTIRLGFVYVTNTQSANQAFGFKAPDPGNIQSEEVAMVDYINHHGGIAGRQIDAKYVAVDNSKAESDPTIGEEVCKTMTEDYHVFAVIAGAGPPDDINANACYAQAGTLNFDLEHAVPDLGFLRQASPYIWLDSDATVDRMMRMEVAGLQRQGFFSGGAGKVGVVVAGDPTNDRVYDQVTLPALHAAGASDVEKFDVPHDTVSDVANTMKQAVIRFQADGVKNVIFQGGGNYGTGSYAILFMVNAESQHYNPKYGLNSDDGPAGLTGNVPQDQFQGAKVVGITPLTDTDDQHYAPWPSTPAEKTCAAIQSAAGNTFASRTAAGVALALCDGMFELQQAAQPLTGGALNAQLWANQAMRLGPNVNNSQMYRAYVGPDHWDAAGGYRLLHAVLNCEGSNACFEYDDSNIYS